MKKAHPVWRTTTVILILILLGLFYRPVTAQETDPSETSSRLSTTMGVVDGFMNSQEATAAGAGWTRVFFRWDVIQPGGPSDWKPANVPDPLLDAELEAGREVVGVIIGTPAWATDSGSSTAVPPMDFWGDFVFRLATQYRGRVNRWVIWNQPDVNNPASPNFTWAGSEEDYYLLLKEAYLKIKAVDPTMQVHLAGLTYTWDQQNGNRQFLARLIDVIRNDPDAIINNFYFDTVSFHHYYDPGELYQIVREVKLILSEGGLDQKPVWINEMNAPPSEDFIEPPLQSPVFKVSLEEQSYYLLQAVALARAAGAERVAFNKLRNESDYIAGGVPYGLLRADNSRRPAFEAFRTAVTYLEGASQVSFEQLGTISVVTFDRTGQTTTMIWNNDRVPVTFSLNAISSQALLVTERGSIETVSAVDGRYTVELPPALCTNGEYCFIGGPPRLIVESGSASQRESLSLTTVGTAEPVPSPVTVSPTSTTPPTATVVPPASTPSQVQPTPVESTPAAVPLSSPSATDAAPEAGPIQTEGAAPLAVLPDSDPAGPGQTGVVEAGPEPTRMPPVSASTVFRPERLLWLFIIGVVVFTITYGVLVAIWSQFRKRR
jgi:hypothetical protein